MTAPTTRCGFLVQHGLSVFTDLPGAYRVSRDGESNIIGEAFFDDINAAGDEAFVEFMTAALRPDFPHPFMFDDSWEVAT